MRWLLCAAVLLGVANAVYHPADYSILGAVIEPSRLGRAFSFHTFAGFLGSALAPILMLALARSLGHAARRSSPAARWAWLRRRCRCSAPAGWTGRSPRGCRRARQPPFRCAGC